MGRHPPERRHCEVVHLAFRIAAERDESCRPVHLLAALSERDGPISVALRPPSGGQVLALPPYPGLPRASRGGYLCIQVQEAAQQLATQRSEAVGPAHLCLAVIDQAEPEAIGLLTQAGLNGQTVRKVALEVLGAPLDLPALSMPPLTPAGTMDRAALSVTELDPIAWATLLRRQDRLPLALVHRRSQYEALRHLESEAVWRVASKLSLDDDQRYSLAYWHLERVDRLAAAVVPGVEQVIRRQASGYPVGELLTDGSRHRVFYRHRGLRWMSGWGAWFSNRGAGLTNRWFLVRTIAHSRGARDAAG
jgi:hypothetical protein